MLIPARFREPIARGEVTLTFRRWKRCQVVAGNTYRTAAGRIVVDAVDEVDPGHITETDAERAGFSSRADLLAALRGDPELPTYRIRLHAAEGADPRAELAVTAALTDEQRAEIGRRLERLDRASSHGPWTHAVLQAIAAHPGVRAADLARGFGRETQPFKLDVSNLRKVHSRPCYERAYM